MGIGGLKRSVCVKGWDLSKLHVERARWTTTRRGAGSFDWKERTVGLRDDFDELRIPPPTLPLSISVTVLLASLC